MDWQQVVFFTVTLVVFASFVVGRWPIELTALSAATVLLVTGLLSPAELLACFSNSAPVTIAALFVLTAALERTGQIARLGEVFNLLAKGSEKRALALILVGCIIISAFVNNTPLVVVLMPVILGFCKQTGHKASRLLIPLSFATILGGTCSMAGTSTNILADGLMRKQGLDGLSLFSIAPLGLIYAAVGGLYLWFLSGKLLPDRTPMAGTQLPLRGRDFLVQVAVSTNSPFIGRSLKNVLQLQKGRPSILEVRRRGQILTQSLEAIVLEENDRILIRTGTRGVTQLKNVDGFALGDDQEGFEALERRDAFLVEGMVGEHSGLVGKTLQELGFRQTYAALILAIHREGRNVSESFESIRLEAGDVLLVEGTSEGIDRLRKLRDFILLSEPNEVDYKGDKGRFALAGIGLFVLLASFNFAWIGLPQLQFDTFAAAFVSAVFVLVTGCLRPSEAYEAIDWRIILLIVGMLGLGTVMETSGAAATLADGLVGVVGPLGPLAILCGLYLLTTILTEMISNNAVAVILVPIAISLSESLSVSPLPFVIAVMFAASASFATPIGYQTNTYVFAAGGYEFSDFVRVGLPLNALLWITATVVIPILWPF